MTNQELIQCRKAFIAGFLQFLPDNLQDEHAWPAMQAYVKAQLNAHGETPFTYTIVAQDWNNLEEAFIQNLANIDGLDGLTSHLEHAYTFGYLDTAPPFQSWRSHAKLRAIEQTKRAIDRMQLQLSWRHNQLETGFGFPDYRGENTFMPKKIPTPNDPVDHVIDTSLPPGVASLLITHAQNYPNSVAFDVVGTKSGIEQFVTALRMEGLHARAYV